MVRCSRPGFFMPEDVRFARAYSRRAAFTLLELLVAIAVIAVLAGILLPVLSRSRQAAQDVQCLSGTRQLAIANWMFAIDHDQFVYWAPGTDRRRLLSPYLTEGSNSTYRDQDVWNCPRNQLQEDPEAPGQALAASYGFNTYLNHERTERVRSPAATVMVADGGINDAGEPNTATHLWPPSRPGTGGGEARPNPRHRGKAVAAFCDGHAALTPLEEPFYPGPPTVWTGQTPTVTDPDHPDYKDMLWDLF